MSPTTFLIHSILLATAVTINAEDRERANHNTEFFITIPESTTVFIQPPGEAASDPQQSSLHHGDTDNQIYNQTWGEFQCVTRPGYLPLWIINGVSADLIQQQPGYANTTYELIPLHDRGHTLTILSIPASRLTNQSVVTCAAVRNKTTLNVVGYSSPVNLVVQIKMNEGTSFYNGTTSSSATYVVNTATVARKTTSPPDTFHRTSLRLILGLGAGLIVLLLAIAALLMFAAIIIAFRRKNRLRRLKVQTRAEKSNIYWNPMSVNGSLKMNRSESEDSKGSTKTNL